MERWVKSRSVDKRVGRWGARFVAEDASAARRFTKHPERSPPATSSQREAVGGRTFIYVLQEGRLNAVRGGFCRVCSLKDVVSSLQP